MGPYPDTDWEPDALELPLEDPTRQIPVRNHDERLQDDAQMDLGRTVIVIDLA
jgi:hypothetical protein